MIRFILIANIFLLIGCVEHPKTHQEYYPSGEIKFLKEYTSDDSYCEILYYENGNIRRKICVKDDMFQGIGKEFYESGEIYCKMNFKDNVMDGVTEFYYKDGSLKAINLFSNDSLYYVRSITADQRDSVDQIYPIIDIQSGVEESDSVNISIEIPFTDLFPYRDSTLVVHYTISHYIDKQKFRLPREKSFILDKNKQNMSLSYIPKDTGRYVFFGLITINDEPLKHFNQNFFERELPYYGKREN